MNRADVTILLRRLSVGFGRKPADTAMIDEYTRILGSYDPIDAFKALDAFLHRGEPGPSAAALIAEIRRTRQPEPSPPPADEPFAKLSPERIQQILDDNIAAGRAERDQLRAAFHQRHRWVGPGLLGPDKPA